jgi:hypothetical protein
MGEQLCIYLTLSHSRNQLDHKLFAMQQNHFNLTVPNPAVGRRTAGGGSSLRERVFDIGALEPKRTPEQTRQTSTF